MKHKVLQVVLSLGLVVCSLTSQAVVVESLYETYVPVSTRSLEIRESAGAQALAEVFVRVSGRESVLTHSKIKRALLRTNNYILQYRYKATDGTKGHVLYFEFDPIAVKRTLKSAGEKVWPANRPNVVMWWSLDLGDKQSLMVLSAGSKEYGAPLYEEAVSRGVPLVLPRMTALERGKMSMSDIRQGNASLLVKLSEPYHAEVIVSGGIKKTLDGKWQAQWRLRRGMEVLSKKSTGTTLASLYAGIVDELAVFLVEQGGTLSTLEKEDGVVISIGGVSRVEDYAKVTSHLLGLAGVNRAQLLKVEGKQLLFRLKVQGSSTQLLKALSKDRHLVMLSRVSSTEGDTQRLSLNSFRWVP